MKFKSDIEVQEGLKDSSGSSGTAGQILTSSGTTVSWSTADPTSASGTTNYVSKFTGTTTLGNSQIFDNGTNIGIGTTTPDVALDVVGTYLSTLFRVSNTEADATTKYGSFMGRHYTNSEENITGMLLTSSSNALIGGSVSIGGGITSANAVNEIKFYTAANNTTLSGSERMRITNSGNVGIGTTSPVSKLTVVGDIMLRNPNGTNPTDAGSFIFNESGTTWGTDIYGFRFNLNGSSNVLTLQSANTTTVNDIISFTRDSASVGIGTTSPAYKLVVDSNTAPQVLVKNSGGGNAKILFENNGGLTQNASITFDQSSENTLTIATGYVSTNDTNRIVLAPGESVAMTLRGGNDSTNTAGAIQFNGYVGTRQTGTPTYLLGTDASGNIVKTNTVPGSAAGPYLPLTGGTMTGTNGVLFPDNFKLNIGTGSDLQIYHNGSNSFIQDVGTGFLEIDTNGTDVRITKTDNEFMAKFVTDAQVELYYNGSKKFETTSTGVTVTGAATATTFLGDLNGTINTVTTAVTKANSTNDTTVATTAFVQNLIGTIPAGLVFQGTWNAATNTPTLTSGTGTTGNFYIVSTSGSTNLDGVTDWVTGDWAVFIEQGATDAWEKIDNSSVLDGAGTGQKVTKWAGSGTSNTLTDGPITFSTNDSTFAGNITTSGTNATVFADRFSGLGVGTVIGPNGAGTVFLRPSGVGATGSQSSFTTTLATIGTDATFAGNVGIGTTTPSTKLDVNGDALINGITVGRGGGNIANNTADGYQALYLNTTGFNNTANGYQALRSNTTGADNTANGLQALYFNTTGNYNTANGYQALFSNTTGNYNTANGMYALRANTTGSNNTANGLEALRSNTTGANNAVNGFQALYFNTTGSNNTANGFQALFSNTTGGNNVANGLYALRSNTTGVSNTANGRDALYSNTTGSYNTANGMYAGRYIANKSTAATILNNSIMLGYGTSPLADNQTNQIVIGYDATGDGSNTATLGNTSITKTILRGNVETNGSSKVGDDVAAASATNVGAIRYRADANNSYAEMVMQTGAATYAWTTIVQHTW